MKVRSSIKRRSRDCQIVVRKGKRLVINKKNPRLKQRRSIRKTNIPIGSSSSVAGVCRWVHQEVRNPAEILPGFIGA